MNEKSSHDLELIRSKVNLVDLIGQKVFLKKLGKHWKGLCPFHDDKTPSFQISPEIGRYRCWSCGAKGDIFDWVMNSQNVDFPEALTILAKFCGVTLSSSKQKNAQNSQWLKYEVIMNLALNFFTDELSRSKQAIDYCATRGLKKETLEIWKIGYAPEFGDALAAYLKKKGVTLSDCKSLYLLSKDTQGGFYDIFRDRLIFPICDERGSVIAFGGRLLGPGQPKYINSADTPLYSKRRYLYGFHLAKEHIAKENRAILVEGYLDAIACHEAGLNMAVASLGTAMSEEHAKLLRRWCDRIVILYDPDQAGSKAAESAAQVLLSLDFNVKIAVLPQETDPDTFVQKKGTSALHQIIDEAVSFLDFRMMLLRKRFKVEEDAFWTEALNILAENKDPIEFEKHLLGLAGEYPELRDAEAAKRALRKRVLTLQREAKKTGTQPTQQLVPNLTPKSSKHINLGSSEIAIFHAFLSNDNVLRQKAWEFCEQKTFFSTKTGAVLAAEIRKAFSETFPLGTPHIWLSRIDSLICREILEELAFDQNYIIQDQVLTDAIAGLKRLYEKRQLLNIRSEKDIDDAKLAEFHQRLKKIKLEK